MERELKYSSLSLSSIELGSFPFCLLHAFLDPAGYSLAPYKALFSCGTESLVSDKSHQSGTHKFFFLPLEFSFRKPYS